MVKQIITGLGITLLLIIANPIHTNAKVLDHFDPYGNLYLFLGANHADRLDFSGINTIKQTDLIYSAHKHSHIGFKFNYKHYKAAFELGMDPMDDQLQAVIRRAYGEYDFGNVTLMAGKDWSPYTSFSHEMAEFYRSLGFGSLYQDPRLQVKISFSGLYISLMKPYVPTNKFYQEYESTSPTASGTADQSYELVSIEREVTTGLSVENINSYVPILVLGYEHKTSSMHLNLGGAINTYSLNEPDYITFNKKWIYSYLLYLNSTFFMDNFQVKISGGFSVNPANFGIYTQSMGTITFAGGAAVALENIATDEFEIKDTWNAQAYLELGYKINKQLNIFAGYGYSYTQYPNQGTKADQAMQYFINAEYQLGSLFFITPAFSMRDYQNNMAGDDEGWELFAGVLATVSF